MNQNFFEPNLCYKPNSSSFDQYHSSQSSVTPQLPQRANEDVRLEMAKLIKNNRILLNKNDFPHEETSMEEYLEKFPDAVTTVLPTEEPEYSLSMGEYDVTSDDESECDVPDKDESFSVFTTFSNILFNDNDDLDSSDDESLPEEDDGDSQREEIDIVTETDDVLSLSVENDDDSEGEIDVVEELLSDISISFTEDEASDSDHQDDPSFPRPPPEPPDAEFDFETDAKEEIPVVMNDKDELNDDYFPFMFVI
nr:hypothetical protein [Tanacetum cinerariifolium]